MRCCLVSATLSMLSKTMGEVNRKLLSPGVLLTCYLLPGVSYRFAPEQLTYFRVNRDYLRLLPLVMSLVTSMGTFTTLCASRKYYGGWVPFSLRPRSCFWATTWTEVPTDLRWLRTFWHKSFSCPLSSYLSEVGVVLYNCTVRRGCEYIYM